MNRIILLLCIGFGIFSSRAQEDILLKDYRPKSVYNIQKTLVSRAKYPVIDVHSHPYASSDEEIEEWIKTMDAKGIEKTLILSYQTGKEFDSIYNIYSKYGDRFEVWCGFDYSGYGEKGWTNKAIKELERCFKVGARGVGELGDKGSGLFYSQPSPAPGMHINDPRMQPLLKRCGELGMPVNIHVAEPIWMYEPIDNENDGLMNAEKWQIDKSKPDLLLHGELIDTLDEAVGNNPGTTFIACHYANCSYDLNILGKLFDKHKNLYADISARYAETAPTPRATGAFYKKYQDRLLYGTDMGMDTSMYQTTFRILETDDEHFYEHDQFGYHWALNGLGLDDETLRKVYSENAKKILK
ncbi:MAG: amidohydrolase family protein [Bacteroidota bacterium]|nr:amidohydrolase family protein [Bacteroidota bacterium]